LLHGLRWGRNLAHEIAVAFAALVPGWPASFARPPPLPDEI
jgi:hypothetical protein